MTTKLKNLKITKVDFVDEGANPDAYIMLYKSKNGAQDAGTEDPEGEANQNPEDPEDKGTAGKEKKSLAKRLMDLFAEFIGSSADEQAETLENIEKSTATTFKENYNRRQLSRIFDEVWSVCYSLNDSLCSIMGDAELDAEQTKAQMMQSVSDFTEVINDCIQKWVQGTESNVVMKSADLTELQIQTMTAARDRMSDIIEKAAEQSAGMEPENVTATHEGNEVKDMKFDKSKMTAEERAALEDFEKRYGMSDGEGTDPEEDVQKKAPEHKEEPTEDDIYKGLNPAVKAEIEALKKYREDAEDDKLRSIAKRYEIIGKKEEDLFPVLKSLKATSEEAFNSMVETLDQAKLSVEKSGAFSEVGKSGNGSAGADSWSIAEARAGEIMKSKSVSKNQALQEVFTADPELAHKCKEED